MDAGDLVAGRYRLLSLVGRGAMGIVWRARDERADRVVAVKQLLLDTSATGSSTDASANSEANSEADAARRRAIREGHIAGRLRHPHAIAVYDVVEHDGNPCLIMEYLPSESLSAVLGSRGVLPAEEVAGLGSQVAAALAEAHAVGIVHRDIKPDNVLIAADGTAKITDFGVSRAAGDGDGTVFGTVTGTGFLAGTPAYLAPEVAAGREADFRSDVFSLGATLYAALEGAPPFGLDANPIALLHRVAHGQIAPPQRSGPLTGLLLSLLRRDPAERPTMRQAHEALAAATAGQPIPPFRQRTPTLVLPARRLPRRGVIAGISAATLVAAGVVIGILISGNRTTSGETAAPPTMTSPPTTTRDDPTCRARYEITNSWPDGHEARVTVHNDGDRALTGWVVSWTQPDDHKINNVWNGVLSQDGGSVTVTNAGWNVTVPAGGSTTFGLVAGAPQADRTPPDVRCQSQ